MPGVLETRSALSTLAGLPATADMLTDGAKLERSISNACRRWTIPTRW